MEILELNHKAVLQFLPDRLADSHKGDYGRILLLCGSEGYTGAAALAAMGALRSGAGLVYLGVPREIYGIEAVKLTEPVVFPLTGKDGKMCEASIKQIQHKLANMDAVLIGSGSGICDGVYYVVKYVLENYSGPVILDADGINVMSEHKDILRGRTAPTIITPHLGEYARFCGYMPNDPIMDAFQTAALLGITVVLKGHKTVVTDGVSLYRNNTGNPGMATGGSGDVLAGMILSLLGQGLPPMDAAACAVWLHGAAGDICAEEIGQYGMLPSDLLNIIPRLMK